MLGLDSRQIRGDAGERQSTLKPFFLCSFIKLEERKFKGDWD